MLFSLSLPFRAQVANYVNNGGFEEKYNCNWPNDLSKAKYWLAIDSSSFVGGLMNSCPNYSVVPSNAFTFQYPRSGEAYALSTWFFQQQGSNGRGYQKNRLKAKLTAGETYCVKYYVNISNNSTHGMDGFGIYFGGSEIDTITKCDIPLPYISPQVHNPIHHVVTDTLNWTVITGTFVANGNEKYALLGNFIADSSLDTVLINPTNLPLRGTDVCIDDVSCIPIALPAFAGNDTTCISGTSVYIGRQRDVGIDEACMWYKLPVVITPTTLAIDTAAGIWVSPSQTTNYVVRQEICGIVKWDTVVVRQDWTGIEKFKKIDGLNFYPNPARTQLTFDMDAATDNEVIIFFISDQLGRLIRKDELVFSNRRAVLDVSDLNEGVYITCSKGTDGTSKRGKLIISR